MSTTTEGSATPAQVTSPLTFTAEEARAVRLALRPTIKMDVPGPAWATEVPPFEATQLMPREFDRVVEREIATVHETRVSLNQYQSIINGVHEDGPLGVSVNNDDLTVEQAGELLVALAKALHAAAEINIEAAVL